MRIKDKKMFVRGILLLLLGVGIAISRFCIFTDATHGMLRPIIFIGICLLAALYHMVMALIFALRPKKTEEDLIAEQDERNQYIELKCAAKAFRVALHASFMTIIAGMIAFGLTREYAFIWLVMGGILPYGASRIAYIVSAFRYDK